MMTFLSLTRTEGKEGREREKGMRKPQEGGKRGFVPPHLPVHKKKNKKKKREERGERGWVRSYFERKKSRLRAEREGIFGMLARGERSISEQRKRGKNHRDHEKAIEDPIHYSFTRRRKEGFKFMRKGSRVSRLHNFREKEKGSENVVTTLFHRGGEEKRKRGGPRGQCFFMGQKRREEVLIRGRGRTRLW